MSDSMLKREFRERDVQRMRNIITKDYTAKTVTQVGYSKAQVDHKEGDVWEENGKKWTIKNGIKQTVTRFDKLKQTLNLMFYSFFTISTLNTLMTKVSLVISMS